MLRLLFLLVLLLAGCASQSPAPVIERAAPVAPAAEVRDGYYTVKKGDTLYRIALEHGQDYKDLAAWNKLDKPNRLEVGQLVRVSPPEGTAVSPVAVVKPIAAPSPVEIKQTGVAPAPTSATDSGKLKREPKGGKVPYSETNLAMLRSSEGVPSAAVPAPPESPPEKAVPAVAVPAAADGIDWAWPAAGKVMTGFADTGAQANKGLDIAGKPGEPVQAAASGKVVYVGNGLRGYGNLVIVRHNAVFLSAYAHNSKILVSEGATVSKGQKIAEIGSSDTDKPKLHFEIRQQGKPVDPAKYLPPR